MTTGRSELLRRVAQALVDLETLAEAPAASDFDAKPAIRHLKPSSGGPQRHTATAEEQHRTLKAWCEAAERTIAGERKGPRKKAETPEQFRFRIVTEHEGKHYVDVADIEKVSPAYVRKIRTDDGRDSLRGRKTAASAA